MTNIKRELESISDIGRRIGLYDAATYIIRNGHGKSSSALAAEIIALAERGPSTAHDLTCQRCGGEAIEVAGSMECGTCGEKNNLRVAQ